jgi:hypothetical protein
MAFFIGGAGKNFIRPVKKKPVRDRPVSNWKGVQALLITPNISEIRARTIRM